MIIKDEHIKEAEGLLINGNEFDSDERVPFIRNLNTCDLLAVPGSGKTTALQAKLYCLSKHLPFKDGSGILVLSHTNSAIEEIEKNLKIHCPSLFEYPNFIGTVQSFINKFFVIPYYSQYRGNVIVHIDDSIYYNEIEKKLKSVYISEINYYKHNDAGLFFNSRFWYDENGNFIISNGVTNNKIRLNVPRKWITENTAEGKKEKVYKFIENLKLSLINKGILHYDDCYFIASQFINKQKKVKDVIKKRFKYVFIDEMQDLEKYQIDIIDKIFYEGESLSIVQRIGDINQAIYNSGKKVKVEADWEPRNQMYINGSNRLTSETANVVNYFTLDRQHDDNGDPRFIVNGLRQLDTQIKPHIVVFNDQTVGRLEAKFKDLIRDYSLQETNEGKKYGFNIIGWNARWDDNEDHNGKLRLENIFESYKKEAKGVKETFDSLSKYVQLFDHDKITLEATRKAILNSLIHILRLEDKTIQKRIRGNDVIRYYSKSEMIKYIQDEKNECDYDLFKNKIFEWSFDLATKRNYEEVYNYLKVFVLSEFKEWFSLEISPKTVDFLRDQFERLVQVNNSSSGQNNDDSLKVYVGTVHSAKGQTHCATMYVETAYQRPTYETQKVVKQNSNPFLLQEHNCNGKYDKQALKMMYVGFSRPTHLLCFAAFKENVQNELENLSNVGWEIIDLTIS